MAVWPNERVIVRGFGLRAKGWFLGGSKLELQICLKVGMQIDNRNEPKTEFLGKIPISNIRHT